MQMEAMPAMRSGMRFILAPTGGLKVVSQYVVEIIDFANMLKRPRYLG